MVLQLLALAMDDDGITHDPEKRLAIAEKILEGLLEQGLKKKMLLLILWLWL